MHKIAFLTDIHANFPALRSVLNKIRELRPDEIILGGDCIGIGPYPFETLELVMNLPNTSFINGNHELVAIHGIDKIVGNFDSDQDGYLKHAEWCNSQLTTRMKEFLLKQPLMLLNEIEGVSCSFMHYALDLRHQDTVNPYKSDKIGDDAIESIFSEFTGSLIGFGHLHNSFYHTTESRTYINPGSLGCFDKPTARFAIIEFHQGKFAIKEYAVNYDDTELYKKFEERNVPDRNFIYKTFFGGRFTVK